MRLAILLCFLLACASAVSAEEPRARFTRNGDFVEMILKRDGKPVPDAKIEVFDERGKKGPEGETGPDGDGAFPLPAGASFTVEIKIDGKTADAIRLYRTADSVLPARVLLSYGLRPCCRGVEKKPPIIVGNPIIEEQPSAWRWLWLTPIALILSGALLTTARTNRAAREKPAS